MAAQVRNPATLMVNLASFTRAEVPSPILLAGLPEQQPKRTQSKLSTIPQAELLSSFYAFLECDLAIFFRKTVVFAEVLPVSPVMTDCWKVHHG